MWVTSSITAALTPTTIALGNFDGLHRGHQQVLFPILHGDADLIRDQNLIPVAGGNRQGFSVETVCSSAHRYTSGTQEHPPARCYGTLVTFHPHPQEFFTGKSRKLLTPLDEKVALLREMGVEQLILLPFDQNLAVLSPREFVEKILLRQLGAKQISVGENFRFGYQRAGTTKDLEKIAWEYGVKVNIIPLENCQEERISSSQIRSYLEAGNIKAANRLLGRSYCLQGTVVKGKQLGRTIGFPTANLLLPEDKYLPRNGVYAVRVYIENGQQNMVAYSGVMNIGIRPTVDGLNLTTEVHIFDWQGDLYGQKITVTLEEFLRNEQKFASLEALKNQINQDCIQAQKVLNW